MPKALKLPLRNAVKTTRADSPVRGGPSFVDIQPVELCGTGDGRKRSANGHSVIAAEKKNRNGVPTPACTDPQQCICNYGQLQIVSRSGDLPIALQKVAVGEPWISDHARIVLWAISKDRFKPRCQLAIFYLILVDHPVILLIDLDVDRAVLVNLTNAVRMQQMFVLNGRDLRHLHPHADRLLWPMRSRQHQHQQHKQAAQGGSRGLEPSIELHIELDTAPRQIVPGESSYVA